MNIEDEAVTYINNNLHIARMMARNKKSGVWHFLQEEDNKMKVTFVPLFRCKIEFDRFLDEIIDKIIIAIKNCDTKKDRIILYENQTEGTFSLSTVDFY